MENIASKIKCSIHNKDEDKMIEMLSSGLDPNFEGGWPIRLAARKGCYSIVKTLLHFGANPHSVSESGKLIGKLGMKVSISVTSLPYLINLTRYEPS